MNCGGSGILVWKGFALRAGTYPCQRFASLGLDVMRHVAGVITEFSSGLTLTARRRVENSPMSPAVWLQRAPRPRNAPSPGVCPLPGDPRFEALLNEPKKNAPLF